MCETTVAEDEPDTTLKTEFGYNEKNSEKKSWKFRYNETSPRSKVVFAAQMLVFSILLSFCILKLSFTRIICKITFVWFSILSGLASNVLLNPTI